MLKVVLASANTQTRSTKSSGIVCRFVLPIPINTKPWLHLDVSEWHPARRRRCTVTQTQAIGYLVDGSAVFVLMSASPKMAKSGHKCTKCGETDLSKFSKNRAQRNGLQYLCRSCAKVYQANYKRGVRVEKKLVTILCGNCDKGFELSERRARIRHKQRADNGNDDGRLFCSIPCASQYHMAHGKVHGRKPKVRNWKSDDQNYWEQVLHDERLGMWRGWNSKVVLYGLHRFVEEMGPDGKIRIATGLAEKND